MRTRRTKGQDSEQLYERFIEENRSWWRAQGWMIGLPLGILVGGIAWALIAYA